MSYLTGPEIDALLVAPDRTSWYGRRDHALLVTAVQTGLRLSEQGVNDTRSYRLCIFDAWGETREEAVAQARARAAALSFGLVPVEAGIA